ncbi:MAG: lytic transglycosylase domain-containing protein [Syntrophales bacterium]
MKVCISGKGGIKADRLLEDTRSDYEKGGSFKKLLEHALAKPPAENDATSLNQEKLLQLLQMIRVQMNNRLIQATTGEGTQHRNSGDAVLLRLFSLYENAIQEKPHPVSNIHASYQKSGRTAGVSGGFDVLIEKAARRFDVDPGLIRAVIETESNFNPGATSSKGAIGLMQLMPDTARELGVKDAYDPEENIMAGTRYLKSLLNRYHGDTELALAAYNWGMGNLEKSTGRFPRETLDYIARVNERLRNRV